jgi:hypothetical protein
MPQDKAKLLVLRSWAAIVCRKQNKSNSWNSTSSTTRLGGQWPLRNGVHRAQLDESVCYKRSGMRSDYVHLASTRFAELRHPIAIVWLANVHPTMRLNADNKWLVCWKSLCCITESPVPSVIYTYFSPRMPFEVSDPFSTWRSQNIV